LQGVEILMLLVQAMRSAPTTLATTDFAVDFWRLLRQAINCTSTIRPTRGSTLSGNAKPTTSMD
jgi:hypothetical protein